MEKLSFRFSITSQAREGGGRIPDKKHKDLETGDAGWDVYPCQLAAPWPQFPVTLAPGQALAVPTGLTFAAPPKWFAEVIAKTGRALQGIVPAAVVFDNGYRPKADAPEGSVFSIRNISDRPFEVKLDQAFAQLILRPMCPAESVEVEHGSIETDTERGGKRYGMADGDKDGVAEFLKR